MLEILVAHCTLPDQILKMSDQLYIMIHHDDWKSPQYILNHQFVKCLTKRKIWKGLQYKNYFEQQDYKMCKKYGKMKSVFLVSDWKCKLKYTWTFPWILQIAMK